MKTLTPEQIHKNMVAIKSKDSKIEWLLRRALWAKGIRYRKNYSKVFGTPDIAITKRKIAIFVDGEFWHGFDWENQKMKIKTHQEYWIPKIERNIERDIEVNQRLQEEGWTVVRFWGKQIEKHLDECVEQILNMIE